MTREMKISLGILSVLVLSLGGIVAWKVMWPGKQIVATDNDTRGVRPLKIDEPEEPAQKPPRANRWQQPSDAAAAIAQEDAIDAASTSDEPRAAKSASYFDAASSSEAPADGNSDNAQDDTADTAQDASPAGNDDTQEPAEPLLLPTFDRALLDAQPGARADGKQAGSSDGEDVDEWAQAASEQPAEESNVQDDQGNSGSDENFAPLFQADDALQSDSPPRRLAVDPAARPIDAAGNQFTSSASDGPAAGPALDPATTSKRANRDSRPLRSVLVAPGSRLPKAHGGEVATAAHQEPLGKQEYVVEEGDSLFDVARLRLGKANRWVEIYDLNRDVLGDEVDFLTPGTRLLMPESAGRD